MIIGQLPQSECLWTGGSLGWVMVPFPVTQKASTNECKAFAANCQRVSRYEDKARWIRL